MAIRDAHFERGADTPCCKAVRVADFATADLVHCTRSCLPVLYICLSSTMPCRKEKILCSAHESHVVLTPERLRGGRGSE